MTKLEFDGDVVIVTGAGGGMGRTHAIELARRGARVVVNDLGGHPFGGGADPSLAEAVVEEIRAFSGEAIANTESVATAEGGASLTETALKTWGRLDAVVANAAITRDGPFEDMTPGDFGDVLNVNLWGAFYTCQPAYRALKKGGGGRLLVVTSTAGLLGAHNMANYAASKSALIGLTRTIALEGKQHGIKANLLSPGALGTRMHLAGIALHEADEHQKATPQLANPAKFDRLMPECVSPMVTVLVHSSCPCTGQVLHARGGMFQQPIITFNDGWVAPRQGIPTAEDIAAHWAEVTDQSTAEDVGLDAFAHGARAYDHYVADPAEA